MAPGVDQLIVALGLTCIGWAALEKRWLLGAFGLSMVVLCLVVPHLVALRGRP